MAETMANRELSSSLISPSNVQQNGSSVRQSRPHIYELDPLRATTAIVVVLVHVLAFTAYLNRTTIGIEIQNAAVIAVHYTREMFMFVTAFALVYVYYGKPFSASRFFTRRALGVLLPYCVWSLVYLLFNQFVFHGQVQPTFGAFFSTLIYDIMTGRASYQLYYILLTVQFYILFPLFLPFVSFIKKHPWSTLAVSFVLELILLYLDYHTLQRGEGAHSSFWQFISQYQDSIVFIYQFYFILGALTALYLRQIFAFLQRFGWLTIIGFLGGIGALWIHFFIQILYYKEPMGYAVSVLQPIMVFYSLGTIAFFFWLAHLWAKNTTPATNPRSYKLWSTLSDASFGVYLIHGLFLDWFMRWFVPGMPQIWPVAIRVLLTWFITAGCAILASIVLMNIPVASRLVGRSSPPSRGIFPSRGILHSRQIKKIQPDIENTSHVQKALDSSSR
ncbi:MAG TPA: acyltransferase [Ktedonobacteraceae bacterium]|nr:acyltransferase [Ktedonobacteraceae bacterium]